ncbi:MAG: metallophosphoesterase [Ruminococcus sp.]|jgi:predicted phosphohydrolase|nr:metallophosphoesterase [Ruminococcus sp.]
MSLYTIADLHLTSFPEKRMDNFSGWENYIERLIANWGDIVTSDDTVVIPGDIAWALKVSDDFSAFQLLGDLPGRKILIKGNHDLWWNRSGRLYKTFAEFPSFSLNFLQNSSFEHEDFAICGCTGVDLTLQNQNEKINARNVLRLARSIETADKNAKTIVFMHFPPIIYENGSLIFAEDILNILTKNNVSDCYYGHLHGDDIKYSYNGEYNGVKFHLISADFVQFKPVLVV